MNKILTFSIIFIFIILFGVKAQSDTSRSKILSFVPQYLINNGIRIDYEIRLKNNHWLQLCPQFYLTEKGSDTNYDEDYKEVTGIGLQAYHKIFLNTDYQNFGAYFSYGFAYNFFNIAIDENSGSVTDLANTQINKFGADLIIGYQTTFAQRLVFDVYTGVGGRYSQYKYSGTTRPKYNETYWSYGYTGNIFLLGFRLGVNF